MMVSKSFTFATEKLIEEHRVVEWLQKHGPLASTLCCVIAGTLEEWQACGAKIRVNGEVVPPDWFGKKCVAPTLAEHLWDGGYTSGSVGRLSSDKAFSQLCLLRGRRQAEIEYAAELSQKEVETQAVIECEEYARKVGGHLGELALEGLDCRGAVMGWFAKTLAERMETTPIVTTNQVEAYQIRERGSPPPSALAVLRRLKSSVVSLQPALPSCVEVKVGPIGRVTQHCGLGSSKLPEVWSGIPLEIRIPGMNPVLTIWSTDDRDLKG